jgi:hypothetical protein
LIITVEAPHAFHPRPKVTCAGAAGFRRDLTTISRRSKHETKSVSESIHVLQINLHRGSLSSINREQRSEAGPAPAGASNC